MTIEMRRLNGKDIFPMLKLLGRLQIKDDILAIVENNKDADVKSEEDAIQQGIVMFANLAQKVLDNIDLVEEDINRLLSSVTGENPEEIANLPIDEYGGLIFDFFEKPELKGFFGFIVERFKRMRSTK